MVLILEWQGQFHFRSTVMIDNLALLRYQSDKQKTENKIIIFIIFQKQSLLKSTVMVVLRKSQHFKLVYRGYPILKVVFDVTIT